MDAMHAEFRHTPQGQELQARLLNWGRWLRSDDTFRRLDYPDRCPFVFSKSHGHSPAELDALRIEEVVSAMDVAGRESGGNGELMAFVLKVEYAERPDSDMPPVEVRARDVARRFRRTFSVTSYWNYLKCAKAIVYELAGPMAR